MTSVKILSAYDEKFLELGLLTAPEIFRYGDTHGYSYYITTGVFTTNSNFSRPAAWYKIKMLLDEFESKEPSEWLVWIDADACIMNQQFDLRAYLDSIPENTWLVAGSDENGLNSGIMFVRNCKEAKEFFIEVWNRTEFLNHVWWEQAAIHQVISDRANKLADNLTAYQLVDSTTKRIVGLDALGIRTIINAPFNSYDPRIYSQGTYKKGNFILHCPGLPIHQRIQIIKQRLKECGN